MQNLTLPKGVEEEQYEKMFNKALDDAIDTNAANNVIKLLKIDKSKEDVVYKRVTKVCKDKDYNGFLMIDGLVKKLGKGDLKNKFAGFVKENDLLKAEAFLVGKWKWKPDGYDKYTVVKVMPYNNNLVGRLVKVGSYFSDYHYKKNDIYWKDFSFENGRKFICYNLTKYEDGTVEGETASGIINYEKKKMKLNVTGAMTPIRVWKRLK